MAKLILSLFFLFTINSLINAIFFDNFRCEISTCHEFYVGLQDWPRRDEYKAACFSTVFALQAIPGKHGKCINEMTGRLHSPCIYALASVIQKCIKRLYDIPEQDARFYCGYTLMKHCAVHVGLDGHPLNFKLH